MYTGQLLATPVLIAAWIAAVSSCVPSPSAPPALPGQRAVKIGTESAHLVLEHGEGAQVMHPALLVKRRDRLGARYLAVRGLQGGERHIRIDGAQHRLDHLAAIVHFGD